MILTDISDSELRWLDDLAALEPEVRDALLILIGALREREGATVHSGRTLFRHEGQEAKISEQIGVDISGRDTK